MNVELLDFRILREDDFDDVWDFIYKEYFSREPICAVSKFTPEEADMYLGDYIRDAMWQGVSIGAYDKESRELVAVRISILGSKPRKFSRSDDGFPLKVRQAIKLLLLMLGNVSEVMGTKEYMQFVVLCTKSDRSNAGIGTELYKRGEAIARARGCKKIFTLAINVFTLKIGSKMGYKIEKEILYKDYVDPLSGEKIYQCIKSPNESISLIIKELD